MTKEEKQLLIKDLCARLPYSIKILTEDNDKGHIIGVDDTENGVFVIHIIEDGDSYTCDESVENFKPYLRPMSSMTEEEKEYQKQLIKDIKHGGNIDKLEDFYHSHHFDYRGSIEKGLALKAPEGMYNTSQKWTPLRSGLKENEDGQIVGGLKL